MILQAVALFAVCLGVDGPKPAGEAPEPRFEISELVDLPYHDPVDKDDSLRRINLVLPKGASDFPLLIWIGGGAWAYVDRNQEMNIARQFAARGIGVASIGHRLSPAMWKEPTREQGVQHPAHVEDVAEAFRWIRENAEKYKYSQANLFIGGYSSGGHLAALLSMDGRKLAAVGLKTSDIRGVIPIATTYDVANYHEVFVKEDPRMAKLHVEAVFGDTDAEFKDASPASYIAEMSVPMLVISERNTYDYTKLFEDAIRPAKFQDITFVNFHKFDHGGLWKDLSNAERSPCRDIMVAFIQEHSAD